MITKLNSEILKLSHDASNAIVALRQKAYSNPDEYMETVTLMTKISTLRDTILDTHSYLAKHYSDIEFSPISPVNIKIKYLHEGIEKVKKFPIGDWIDLRSAQDILLSQGDITSIPLGVAMELPPGYEAWLCGRSSLASKFGIIPTVGIGVIDHSYCGDNDEWKLPVYAIRDTSINKNDRICQFRIMPTMPPIIFDQVANLNNPDRGGIGSTGK